MEKLKTNLGFLGNKKDRIYVNIPGIDSDLLTIRVDNYKKAFKYLTDISINGKNQITDSISKSYNQFLAKQNLLYLDYDIQKEKNVRALNFFNNISPLPSRYSIQDKFKNYTIAIIGLGTLGTSLLQYLIQLGIKNFVLIDGDKVEKKNISHQRFYSLVDIGKAKVSVLKEKLPTICENINVVACNKYLSENNLFSKIIDKKLNAVFCAFDNANSDILRDIFDYCHEKNIIPYIAGYKRESVTAQLLSTRSIKSLITESDQYDIIKENSGVGYLGDMAAILLIRLWLQSIVSSTDYGWDYLEYNLFSNKQSLVDNNVLNYYKIERNTTSNFFDKYILNPYIDKLYSEYLRTSQNQYKFEISTLLKKFKKKNNFVENTEERQYEKMLDHLTISYKDKIYSIQEFYYKVLAENQVPLKKYKEFYQKLYKVKSNALNVLKEKQKRIAKKYRKSISNSIEEIIDPIVINLNELYFENNKVDFIKYNLNYKYNYKMSLNDQIEKICRLDNFLPGYEMTQHIKYLFDHNFIDISRNNKNSFTILNQRQFDMNTVISFKNDISGLLNMAHEVGLNYFSSFVLDKKIVDNFSSYTRELFSFMNEILILYSSKNWKRKISYRELLEYLYRQISNPYSIDLYEEGIFTSKNTLDWTSILSIRRSITHRLNPNIKFTNFDVTNLNIVTNFGILFSERKLYLYPEMYLIAFFLVQKFLEEPLLYEKFINYLSQSNDLEYNTILNKVYGETVQGAIKKGGKALLSFLRNYGVDNGN